MIKRVLASLGRITGLTLLAVVVLLLGCQSKLMYYPRSYPAAERRAFQQAGGVELSFITSQGRQVAFYRPPPAEPGTAALWLFCGGNAARALDYSEDVGMWDRSAGWLFIDFPGYGACEGRPNPVTIRENVLGAVDALATHLGATRDALRPRLGASGQSLGAAAALIAADELDLRRVLLLAPFTSMTEMARRTVGWPLCYLNHHRFDNRARLAAVVSRGGQVRLVHGAADQLIPITMSRELAAAHPDAVRLTEVPGADHNNLLDFIGGKLRDQFEELKRGPFNPNQ